MFALFVLWRFFLFGYVTMHLWNWIMPYLFHLPTIEFPMAIGMVIALFKNFIRQTCAWVAGATGAGGGYWRAKMEAGRYERLKKAEKFKSEFADRCRSRWGRVEVKVEKSE